jgi:hypothetical protein
MRLNPFLRPLRLDSFVACRFIYPDKGGTCPVPWRDRRFFNRPTCLRVAASVKAGKSGNNNQIENINRVFRV